MGRVPLVLLLCALLVAACGGDASSLTGELRYMRSGGIAGDVDELVVRPDGRATLKSRRGGDEEFELTREELDALATQAAGMEGERTIATPVPDAIVHEVAYDGRRASADDPHLAKSQIAPLIRQLEKIIEAHR